MVLNSQQLNLNIKPTYIPKTITDFLGEVSGICNVSDKLEKLDDIIKRLEEETIKIDAFKRELPLTVVLINEAIVALKEEVIQCKKTNVEPVLEEFIPLKKSCYEVKDEVEMDKESKDKKNWMSSVQLWNHSENQNSEFNPKQNKLVEINKESVQENVAMTTNLHAPCKSGKEGRAFIPFKGYPTFPVVATKKEDMEESPVARLSLYIPGTSSPSEGLGFSVLSSKASTSIAVSSSSPNAQSRLRTNFQPLGPLQLQTGRKRRRCWSQDLHRRFVSSLQQLGGSQVATPKQIRELMQVDGLTNDEVKSHLQKYRLHTRKVPAGTPAKRHALALGGIWTCQDQSSESAKQSRSQSGSPQGPLQLTETTRGIFTARTNSSMEDDEDDEDDKFENYC